MDSAPTVTTELYICSGLDALGSGLPICSARSRSILGVLCPPGLYLSWGRPDPGLCPCAQCSRACVIRFMLLVAQPPSGSRHPSPSELLPGPALHMLQPIRELGALSLGHSSSVSVPGCLRAYPSSWSPAPTPCKAFLPGKIGAAPDSPGQSSHVLGTLAPALARLLVGPLTLGCRLFLYFFFPCLPTLIEVRTLLTVAFQLFYL